MSAEDWWAVLLQGTVAACISLLGLFGVFWLTRRHENNRDRRRAAEEDKVRRDERTRRNVASVIDAAHGLRAFNEDEERRARQLAHSLMLFSVEEGGDYPNASGWAYQRSGDVLQCLVPGTDPRALSWEAGNIGSSLHKWITSGTPDILHPRDEKKTPNPNDDENAPLWEHILAECVEELRLQGKPATFENVREVQKDVIDSIYEHLHSGQEEVTQAKEND